MMPLIFFFILYATHIAYAFLLMCTTGNVNLLDLRTSQLQNSCIGMVIILESLTGRRGADSWPSPWYGYNALRITTVISKNISTIK